EPDFPKQRKLSACGKSAPTPDTSGETDRPCPNPPGAASRQQHLLDIFNQLVYFNSKKYQLIPLDFFRNTDP
ncbi:hypothetical protein, partial [Rhizobium sp. RU35A]|uniref:hypothetical protein n=1 Tax=Rhizobium sp. RU35A TaxID=1907414 RepID=UPI001AED1D10